MSQGKAVALLILAAILAIGGWVIYDQSSKIAELNVTVKTYEKTINSLNDQIDLDKSGDAIDNKVTAAAAQENQQIHTSADARKSVTDNKEDAIRKKYDKLVADATARAQTTTPTVTALHVATEVELLQQQAAQAISANRLDGLWEEYCATNASKDCPVTPNIKEETS